MKKEEQVCCPLCEGKGKVSKSLSLALGVLVGSVYFWVNPPKAKLSDRMVRNMEQRLFAVAERLFTRKKAGG